MLNEGYEICTNGAGQLSDFSLNAAKETVNQNDKKYISQAEKQRDVDTIIDEMKCSIIQH